jgi:acyl-CoA synthetase (AMP-forming)/AMP-acid ligase II
MTDLRLAPVPSPPRASERLNVADRLATAAAALPDAIAVACPRRFSRSFPSIHRGDSGTTYATTTFAALEVDVNRIARGLAKWGVPPGTRLALLVRPGIDFVALVFALLRAGMVTVLIDPGMGRRNMFRRLAEVEPEGFIAVPTAQAARLLLRRKFPRANWNVTVGRQWAFGGMTLEQLRMLDAGHWMLDIQHPASSIQHPERPQPPVPSSDAPAAIIFTSGSTGPAKGVIYTQRMFDRQVSEIQSAFQIEPGGIDLSCFPLFALFNAAMGVTTVLPDMDFSRPAAADPRKLLAAANDWQVTQAFASPAVWQRLAAHCRDTGDRIPTLRQIFSCGAPVPADVLRSTLAFAAPDAQMHTPYGATECLPVATIEAAEVLEETAARTDAGAGVCVGRKFDSIDWRIIRITDEPIAAIDEADELPSGHIGELAVSGPQVSPRYVTRTECNVESKIADEGAGDLGLGTGDRQPNFPVPSPQPQAPAWHRTGDVGYLDDEGRFWYCGRKSQRVETADGPLFTECVEALFNACPFVGRTALVGVGPRGRQQPALVFEATGEVKSCGNRVAPKYSYLQIVEKLREWSGRHTLTQSVRHFLEYDHLPVDVRHNSKINREQLAIWAAKRVGRPQPPAPSP